MEIYFPYIFDLFLLAPGVGGGGNADDAFEDPAEIKTVLESHRFRHFPDVHIACRQHLSLIHI